VKWFAITILVIAPGLAALADAIKVGVGYFSGRSVSQALGDLVVSLIELSVGLAFCGVLLWRWVPKWTIRESTGTNERSIKL
jgi:hypothetical protein